MTDSSTDCKHPVVKKPRENIVIDRKKLNSKLLPNRFIHLKSDKPLDKEEVKKTKKQPVNTIIPTNLTPLTIGDGKRKNSPKLCQGNQALNDGTRFKELQSQIPLKIGNDNEIILDK